MPVQPWVAGPSILSCGTGLGGALEHIGIVERDTRPQFIAFHQPISTDRTGPMVPDDVQYMGQMAFLQLDLIKFDEAVIAKLQTRVIGGTNGTITAGDIGTLLRHEGKAFRFLIQSQYRNKSAFAGMTGVMNFPVAFAVNVMEPSHSTQAKRWRLQLQFIPNWSGHLGNGVLFNSDETGAPVVS